MSKHRWTPTEIEMLRRNYPHVQTVVLADAMGLTVGKVYQQAARHGLKKSAEYLASEVACRLRRGDNLGAAFRFKPGQVPFNKGTRFVAGGRSAETRFKPGSKPQTWMPVGTYRVNADGILDLKVADTQPSRLGWVGVHRLVWEKAHGPIPSGHAVVFRPGRKTADLAAITEDALECLSRADLARRNSIHRYPPALKQAMRLASKVRRQIDEHQQY